tara:strand:- start:104 stop:1015 length:912 start_codon:yes stop_codon:yes gene_type:complete
MSISALVIGYGSIGKRHVEILVKRNIVSTIAILSGQKNLPYKTISSLDEISSLNPDYIVIASPTNKHFIQLKYIEENFKEKKILVEKPIFHSIFDFKIQSNEVYVGYNLRFHPILNKIKAVCDGRDIWNINVFCGSYLPDWRPDQDYRNSYSAKKESGGGVLLDLSHELDYIQWLVGPLGIDYFLNKKISNLEITSEDFFSFIGKSEYGSYVNISLNYFTRKPIRRIIIDGVGISIQGDLIENNLNIVEDGRESNFSWKDYNINDTYEAQHQAVIDGDLKSICTLKEGLLINNLINKIQQSNL